MDTIEIINNDEVVAKVNLDIEDGRIICMFVTFAKNIKEEYIEAIYKNLYNIVYDNEDDVVQLENIIK